MSWQTPTDREIRIVRELLRSLSSGRQIHLLYPVGHTKRGEAARELREHVLRLREQQAGDPALFVTDGNFYLGPTLLPWESLTLFGLARSFADVDVRSLEFLPDPSTEEMDALLRLLSGEGAAPDELIAVGMNRVGPSAPPIRPEAGMGELLRSYAAGLDLLRTTAARLLAGRPADMDATVRLTERIADLLVADPAQALLLTTVKSYDEYTYHHMVNVCILSLALAHAIGLPRDEAVVLGIGGLLHDVGKVKVPAEILQHDGALDEEQWRLIRRHPVDGAGLVLVTSRDTYHPAVAPVLEHHVAFDGSGYPALSGGRQPSLSSRLVSVADCFDAVTSRRSYREPEERRQALSILQAGAGQAYDPRVVRTFVRMVGIFPVGSLVRLSTGEVAAVVRNHEELLARPIVRVVLDADDEGSEPVEFDLSETGPDGSPLRTVERSVDPAEVGVDMLSVLASAPLGMPPPDDTGPGLVHEPAPGEVAPEGYVEEHGAVAPLDLPIDPEAGRA